MHSSAQRRRRRWFLRKLLPYTPTVPMVSNMPPHPPWGLRPQTTKILVGSLYVKRYSVHAARVCFSMIIVLPVAYPPRPAGSLNLASRDLPCLPSALFEIHLSVTPDKLVSVPEEPPLPEKPSRRAASNSTTWYDQEDLTFLRARNNQIVEIQHEISMFGSLKTIDVRDTNLRNNTG